MADTLPSQMVPASKTLREKLSAWDTKSDPRAPLTERQKDGFIELTTVSASRSLPAELLADDVPSISSTAHASAASTDDVSNMKQPNATKTAKIETAQQFFSWFAGVEAQMENDEEYLHREFLTRLQTYQSECDVMINEIEQCLEFLTVLKTDYVRVATKTNALHEACENLLEDQTRLVHVAENINSRLAYFNELDSISSKLNSPTFAVNSESFLPLLSQLDDGIEYLNKHQKYRETPVYLSKFRHCLSRLLSMLKMQVFGILQASTQQVLPAKNQHVFTIKPVDEDITGPLDDAFTLFYGKFRMNAPRIKSLMEQIEQRLDKSPEYQQLLADCHQCYFQQRLQLLLPSVTSAITELTKRHSRDHCALVRSGCAFMIHICEDEHQLYYHFFSQPTPLLDQTLESLCDRLYDTLRPLIIHISHLETLSELCSILKIEMIEEHVQQNAVQLAAFDMICSQMLQDVQERLVYRTHVYIRQEILNYNPASGDLAYPSKLEMMESIAEKLRMEHEQQQQQQRAAMSVRRDSTSSLQSLTSAEVEEITRTASDANQRIEQFARDSTSAVPSALDAGSAPKSFLNTPFDISSSNMPMSPADLHGMWYPTVRRTLVCMSKLYRCIDKTTFQGLSQETLSMCIQSLIKACDIISKNQSVVDGQLFLIKHLLILREQIAPFHIDFVVKEMALDFSKLRNAAVELLKARSKLFAFNSNNAVLQFLLDGTPAVTETFVDSKKEVDAQLKRTCEDFIRNVTDQLLGQLTNFIAKAKVVVDMYATAAGDSNSQGISATLRLQPFATAEKVRDIVVETYRELKQNRAAVQQKMALYLANKDTEYILFKPIRANVIQCFQQLHRLLDDHYNVEDRQIIAAPTVEQINLLLTSSSHRSQVTASTATTT